QQGKRRTHDAQLLQWQMIPPSSNPVVDVIPFFVKWSASSSHPAQQLSDHHCHLVSLTIRNPDPTPLVALLSSLNFETKVMTGTAQIQAEIKAENGKTVILN
ncbi:MAG: VOC family protein, partial [Saprospiraceae bacterium]|nr:VOC family protein [Saprospiraceae bacterium]